jgi:hypothetical protein
MITALQQDALSGWTIAPEAPRVFAARLRPLLVAALVDEVSGLPPVTPLTGTTPALGLTPRIADGGQCGLIGEPLTRYFPGAVVGAPLTLALQGDGYLPLTLTGLLPAQPGYPGGFAPLDLGRVALHRSPVTLAGRVVSHTGVVRAGAAITLDGVWLTLADLLAAPAAANLVALASPLYADRTAAATVRSQALVEAAPAEAKRLLQPAGIGDAAVRLSDQMALALGDIVAFDPDDPERAEYIAVTGFSDAGSGPDLPVTAGLAFPLRRPHPAGATAIRMQPSPAGAANPLARPARAGDRTLFPAAMAGITPATTAIVVAGGAPDEYHAAGIVATASDGAGYFTLPPVHRVAQLRLRVQHGAEPNDLLRDVFLPFGAEQLGLDLVFP